jgi:hypothetical protein
MCSKYVYTFDPRRRAYDVAVDTLFSFVVSTEGTEFCMCIILSYCNI